MTVTVWLDCWRETVVVRRRFVDEIGGSACNAGSPTATERYRAHCRWLTEAEDHPVVQIVHRDDDQLILSTRFVGPATAATVDLPPPDAARLLSSLASALHRLHVIGMAHGHLTADHVLLRGNRFWLCSPAPSFVGAASPDDDTRAFGLLVEDVLARWALPEPPERPGRSDQRRWLALAEMAKDPSVSAARLAARANELR